MNIPNIFARLFFPIHSAEVYEYLLKHPNQSISALAISLKMHRPAIYHALGALKKHRLVLHSFRGKRRFYAAAPLSRVLKVFENDTQSFYTASPADTRVSYDMPEHVRYFEGSEGISAVFADVIGHTPKGGTFYRYTSEKDLARVNRYLPRDYRKIREKKKLERLVISNPQSGRQKKPRLERFIRYIPRSTDLFDQNIIQLIYGDRLALIDLNNETAIIIENRALVLFQKVIFRQLFKSIS